MPIDPKGSRYASTGETDPAGCIDAGFHRTPSNRFCASHHRWNCERHFRCGPARRYRRGGKSGLIEKGRTAISDGTGQFQIVNLVAGTYAVTFTLGGFNTVKREGVVLSGSFTAKVDAHCSISC